MPGRNRTGPVGTGPKTGRAMGFCAGFGLPGNANFSGTRGLGMGRGGRMGRGRGFGQGYGWTGVTNSYLTPQNLTTDHELESLKIQANYYENSLKEINQLIDELQRENK